MADVQGDPRRIDCPACFAPAGQPCNAPTEEGRRTVTWHHIARESRAGLPAPSSYGIRPHRPWTPEEAEQARRLAETPITGGPWTPEEILAGAHRRPPARLSTCSVCGGTIERRPTAVAGWGHLTETPANADGHQPEPDDGAVARD